MDRPVVIGMDAGGTSTRCAVAGPDGTVVGRGRAGGANHRSSADPGHALAEALRAALADAGMAAAPRVLAAVVGLAGSTGPGGEAAAAAVRSAWRAVGLDREPRITDDIVVAFAGGGAGPDGCVLIAGTGAVAARIRAGELVRRCDGRGWLLGDEGSAVWMAVAGLRAVLARIDGKGPETGLCERLPEALAVPPNDGAALVAAAHALPPAGLGGLAPSVDAAARAGDPVAASIVADAADRLLASLAAVAPDRPSGPVVLAGAVATRGEVADALRRGVRDRFGVEPLTSADGVAGAVRLALDDASAASRNGP